MSLTFGSVCSGIEAASVAWLPLGWRCAFMSEIEAFPRAVLAHHYPETPLHGDFTTIQAGDYGPIDVLVGGTPCQSFSVAGLRGGLADDRGNLALEYLKLANRLRPRWLVWENVPGVLSSNGGRDFGSILGGLVELGYGFAYRVLDAQYFGLAQRRRRVFVVGYLGDWRRAGAVLFDATSLSGNPAPSRQTGEGIAPTISARPTAGGGLGTDFDLDGGLVQSFEAFSHGNYRPGVGTLRAEGGDAGHGSESLVAFDGNDTRGPIDVATAVNAHGGPHGRIDFESETFIAHALRGEGFDASEDGSGRGTPIVPVAFMSNMSASHMTFAHDHTPTLRIGGDGGNSMAVAFALRGREGGAMPEVGGDQAGALRAASGGSTRDYVAFNITPSNSNKDYNARPSDRAQAVTAGGNRPSARGGDLIAFDLAQITSAANRTRVEPDAPASTLNAAGQMHVSGVTIHGTDKTANAASMADLAGSLRTKPPGSTENSSTTAALHGSAVRRLTPTECERLQGFPDSYTDVPYRGKRAADRPRYKALGNSMAVPCMAWIGRRIAEVDALSVAEIAA